MRRLAVTLSIAFLAVVAGVAPRAAAHAAFVSSTPEPGSRLTTAPGVVSLRFSEPLIARLSSATVTDPNGRHFEGRVTEERQLEVRLTTTAPGIYQVDWRTVSPLDGHTLRGSFRFGVGATPGPGAEGRPAADPTRVDLLLAVGRWVEYAALLAVVGSLALAAMARRHPELGWVRHDPVGTLLVALAAGVVVVTGEALLAASDLSAAVTYLTGTSGLARLLRLGWMGVALVALWLGHRQAATAATVGAVAALAGSGHAAAVEPAWWGVAVDAGHLLSAGVWAGGILALAGVRPPGGWRSEAARAFLHHFSRVGLPAFVVTVGLGSLRGVQELARPGDLVGTSYGQVLLLKILAVAAMVPLSWAAWRRRRARPRLEGGLGAAVVALAAVLAAFPVPPGRAGAEEGASREGNLSALPGPDDVTLGGAAGDVLVGLTARPARPGTNELFVHLAPLAGVPAADRRVLVRIDGRPHPVRSCGPTCRQTEASLTGGEQAEVIVSGADGGTVGFTLPQLPAADGATLLRRATARMNDLRTYRIDEVLGPSDPPLRAHWQLQAPDRLRFAVEGSVTTIRIGTTRYTQPAPGAAWQVNRNAPAVEVPVLIWDYPGARAVHIVDQATIAERPVTVLSLFIDVSDNPIWYRLFVDDEGLVHRAEMRAKGHFMDHRYTAFDEELVVDAPEIGLSR